MIPQIIHQIWLSPPMPEKYTAWGRMLRDLHPGWDVRLWTPVNLHDYDLTLDRYDLRGYHPSIVSDVFRILVVHQYGGFYLDCDCEPLGSLEPLRNHEFVCRGPEEPSYFAGRPVRINTGDFFGAPAGSPVLAAYLERCDRMRETEENILYKYGFLGLSEHLYEMRDKLTFIARRELDARYFRHYSAGAWLSPAARDNYRPIATAGPMRDPFKPRRPPPAEKRTTPVPWPTAAQMLTSNRGPNAGCCSRPSNREIRRK